MRTRNGCEALDVDFVNALAIEPDGKFVIGGGTLNGGTNVDSFVARFGTDALLDFGFAGGFVPHEIGDSVDAIDQLQGSRSTRTDGSSPRGSTSVVPTAWRRSSSLGSGRKLVRCKVRLGAHRYAYALWSRWRRPSSSWMTFTGTPRPT